MTIAIKQYGVLGSNPFNLDGPAAATGVASSIPQPAATPGTLAHGDAGSEYVYCKLVLGGSTTLVPGDLYVIDKVFTATLLTTANSPRGSSVGVGLVNLPTAPASGTYYIWLQIAGNAPINATAAAQANLAETTATAGRANFPNSATATSKLLRGLYVYGVSFTFTATTLNGSQVLSSCSDLSDVAVGQTISGTGVPASSFIGGINLDGPNTVRLTTSDLKTAALATASAATITMTIAGLLIANLNRPYVDVTN